MKIRKWSINLIPIITTVSTIVAVIIGLNFFGMDKYDAIISFLIIIAVDLIVIIMGYNLWKIEKSTSKIDNWSKNNPDINFSLEPCTYSNIISQAKNSIFFSGIGMAFMADYDLQNSLA